MKEYRLGIDIGSTTLKAVVIDSDTKEIVFNRYIRHNADINRSLHTTITEIEKEIGDALVYISVTGSIGMV